MNVGFTFARIGRIPIARRQTMRSGASLRCRHGASGHFEQGFQRDADQLVPEPIIREGQEIVVPHPDAVLCAMPYMLLAHEPILRSRQSARQQSAGENLGVSMGRYRDVAESAA